MIRYVDYCYSFIFIYIQFVFIFSCLVRRDPLLMGGSRILAYTSMRRIGNKLLRNKERFCFVREAFSILIKKIHVTYTH